MKSKIAQKILDDLEKESWWYRLKIKLRVEMLVLSCMGFKKYFTSKLKRK